MEEHLAAAHDVKAALLGRLQEGQGDFVANHGSRLQEALLRRWQAVDTRCQDGLFCGWHLNGLQNARLRCRRVLGAV